METNPKSNIMIKINIIEPQTVELFNPDGEFMGFINEYEFHDIRVQIKKEQVDGYYCRWKDHIFHIDKDGRSFDWIPGFFDTMENSLMQLL